MKGHSFPKCAFLLLIICVNFNHSRAKEAQLISSYHHLNLLINQISDWRKTQVDSQQHSTLPTISAGILCFVAASISSAGGVGGGGLFVPILNVIGGLGLKTATSFSAFMVTGVSIASVIYNLFIKNHDLGSKSLVDYDVALLSQPCMLLGVSIGVICNVVFPEWLITVLFTIFLGLSTLKTCRAGVGFWNAESYRMSTFENGLVGDGDGHENSLEENLLSGKERNDMKVPWKKLGILVIIWLSFFVLQVLCGGKDGQMVLQFKQCGIGYWITTSLQLPFAVIFTSFILYRSGSEGNQSSYGKDMCAPTRNHGPSSELIFPLVALLAGVLAGFFGTGGGMLISPIFIHIGVPPEVTAATCSFMVFFSASMSTAQYLLLGMTRVNEALIFASGCFIGSSIGLVILQKIMRKYGRPSLIVFSVGTVMALSTVLLTSFGALDVWKDYTSGKYMGFRLPC